MNQIMHREIQDLNAGRAQIQLLLRAIQARDDCIKQIRDNDVEEFKKA